MTPVEIGATIDRSVIGIMVDFAKSMPYHFEPGHWSESKLQLVEERLSEKPCHAGRAFDRVVFPKEKTSQLLHLKWVANPPPQPAAEKRGG
jgi:hypothetical protein